MFNVADVGAADPKLSGQPGSRPVRSVFKLLANVTHMGFGELGLAATFAGRLSPVSELVSYVFGMGAIAQVFYAVV